MVNFDNETTVATPSKDVMRIYLLQCKAYTEDVWRLYIKNYYAGVETGLYEVKASLEQWYFQIERVINRHWNNKEAGINKDEILNIIKNGKKDDLFKLIVAFNWVLDKINLTKLDTRIVTKRTFEGANIAHGH